MSDTTEIARKTAALIVAGGVGERMGGQLPKQYWELGGITVIARTIQAFAASPVIDDIWVVIHPTHHELFERSCKAIRPAISEVIDGGATRQASVYAGLKAMQKSAPTQVLIHDAVRPFVNAALIEQICSQIAPNQAVIPVLPITDTLKYIAGEEIRNTLPREEIRAVQTPQGFDYKAILSAHQQAKDEDVTDDAAMLEQSGNTQIRWIEGDRRNIKLTTTHDWHQARMAEEHSKEIRVGKGFDVHRLTDHPANTPQNQRVLRLGGIPISFHQYLEGHSDADVLLHAITDALLGGMGAGDIGMHFPPSDPQYKGRDSAFFIAETLGLLKSRGGRILHLDATLICETPRLEPHRDTMIARLVALLEIDRHRINLKATTTEGLGFAGRKEGIAADAIATIELPRP